MAFQSRSSYPVQASHFSFFVLCTAQCILCYCIKYAVRILDSPPAPLSASDLLIWANVRMVMVHFLSTGSHGQSLNLSIESASWTLHLGFKVFTSVRVLDYFSLVASGRQLVKPNFFDFFVFEHHLGKRRQHNIREKGNNTECNCSVTNYFWLILGANGSSIILKQRDTMKIISWRNTIRLYGWVNQMEY